MMFDLLWTWYGTQKLWTRCYESGGVLQKHSKMMMMWSKGKLDMEMEFKT